MCRVVWAIDQSERHLTFTIKGGTLVPCRIASIIVDLPARQEWFTAEETNVLARAVKEK